MEIDSDHNLVFAPYIAAEYADTLDTLFWGDKDEVNGLNIIFRVLTVFAYVYYGSLYRRVG